MAAGDLCALSDVRTWLQKPVADTGQDALIGALITQASAAITRHCRREFAPQTAAGVHRTLRWNPRAPYLSLAPYDAAAITAVRLDPDTSSPTDLSTSDWSALPVGAPDGVYTGVEIEARATSTRRRGWVQVRVTGTWGFAAVPEEVKLACVKTTVRWMRGEVQAFTAAAAGLEPDSLAADRPVGLPADVRALLAPWCRPPF